MIFKSRQVNLDPEPNVDDTTGRRVRSGHIALPGCTFDPRPEFEPTRDPKPWEDGGSFSWDSPGPLEREERAEDCAVPRWAPRRELFDTPVNPILVQLRGELQFVGTGTAERARSFLSDLDRDWKADFTPEQIDHARRVLTRLAKL